MNHIPQAPAAAAPAAGRRPRILVLSSSLLTDRMLAPTTVLPRLAEVADVRVLAASLAAGDRGAWPDDQQFTAVLPFPAVSTVRFFPTGLLQELADVAWEARHQPVSRVDRERDGFPPRSRPKVARAGEILGRMGATRALETAARAAARRSRVPAAVEADLAAWTPDLTLVTNPFHTYETGVAAAARRRGSSVVALIPSWDNLSTKRRMVFGYDGFLVWSEDQAASLQRLYPGQADRSVQVVGTPQYDAFVDPRYEEDRPTWCARHALDPDRPIVLYALGSPNMFDEVPAVETVADAVETGAFGDAQLLVRCHPIHDTEQFAAGLARFAPAVVVQRSVARPDATVRDRTQGVDQLVDWVNTFRHADVVVNLSSTSTLDGAIFDHPVVNLDYDPASGGRRTQLVKEINRLWEHFAPVAQSDGLTLVGDPSELVAAVQAALADPSAGREGRRWIVQTVAGDIDGKAGERFAEAVLGFLPRGSNP